jgi:HK97 family phage portal protein
MFGYVRTIAGMTPALDARRFGTVHTATDGRDILRNDPDGWEVDQPGLWFTGPADSDGTGGPWGNPPPGAENAAPTLQGTALPAVTRCVSLLTESIAGMPWKTYRGREQVTAPAWIADPQAASRDGRLRSHGSDLEVRLSPVEFWAQYITSYLNFGEGIAYLPRELDADGAPTGPVVTPIYVLNPAYVDVEEGRYYVSDPDTSEKIELDSRELLITRNILRPGSQRGLGAIAAHAYDFALSADIRAYLENLFQRGIPNGYLKSTDPAFDQVAANRLKSTWMNAHGNVRKSIAVLNATTEFHPLELDPQAVQITELMRLTAWNVCVIYGVPPSKLGISLGQSNTYSNLEAEGTAFVRDSLLPIARKLEAAIDAILPSGTELKIDFNQLQRADTTARFAAYQVGLAAGFLTLDEVRGFEDLPPLPDLAAPPPALPPAPDPGAPLPPAPAPADDREE